MKKTITFMIISLLFIFCYNENSYSKINSIDKIVSQTVQAQPSPTLKQSIEITNLEISSDKKLLAIGLAGGYESKSMIKLFNLKTNKIVAKFSDPSKSLSDNDNNFNLNIKFSPDNKNMAIAFNTSYEYGPGYYQTVGNLYLCNIENYENYENIPLFIENSSIQYPIDSLNFSDDSKKLIYSKSDSNREYRIFGESIIYDIQTKKRIKICDKCRNIRVIAEANKAILECWKDNNSFAPDNIKLLNLDNYKTIWKINDKKLVNLSISSVSNDKKTLYLTTAYLNFLINIANGKIIKKIEFQDVAQNMISSGMSPTEILFSPDNKKLFFFNDRNLFTTEFNIQSGKVNKIFEQKDFAESGVLNGDKLITGSNKGIIRIWDTKSGHLLNEFDITK